MDQYTLFLSELFTEDTAAPEASTGDEAETPAARRKRSITASVETEIWVWVYFYYV